AALPLRPGDAARLEDHAPDRAGVRDDRGGHGAGARRGRRALRPAVRAGPDRGEPDRDRDLRVLAGPGPDHRRRLAPDAAAAPPAHAGRPARGRHGPERAAARGRRTNHLMTGTGQGSGMTTRATTAGGTSWR